MQKTNTSRVLKFSMLLCFLSFYIVNAQDASVHTPANYSNNVPISFVRTWDAQAPIIDAVVLMSKPLREVKQTTQYVDGIGRPLQTVLRQGALATGGSPTDMVTAEDYDQFGREARKYLRFASLTSDGFFKFNPFEQQQTFYTTQLSGQNENYFYSKIEYEASPLNRIERSYAPGQSWVHNGKGLSMQYQTNTIADAVRVWTVTDVVNDFGAYYNTNDAIYPAGTLYKSSIEDESGKKTVEYTSKEGLVILKKNQISNFPGEDHTGWLCTYYIYDGLNRLRAVIQPKGTENLNLNSSWSTLNANTSLLNELLFRYEYDTRGRIIMKKVPGTEPVYMVYDSKDRLVMMQDGNMRNPSHPPQWLCTTYDNLNRPFSTGMLTDYNSFSYHLTQASQSSSYPNTSGYEILTETHYDNYIGQPSGLGISNSLDNSYNTSIISTYNTFPEYAEPVIATSQTGGMVTWSKIKILGTSLYEYTVNIYDYKGRVIQVQSLNQTGAIDIATTQYNFAGKVLRTHLKLQKSGAATIEIATKNTYDDLSRIIKVEKQVNNSGWKSISEITYDALGQTKARKLSPNYNGGAGLETLTYDYNVRGWMLGANRDYAKDPNNISNYFGFDLGYDKQTVSNLGSYAAPQYNGNITGVVWKSKGDNEVRKYDFTYDAVNRLTAADFNQYTGGFNKSAGVDFSVNNLSYDENGNILSMKQDGLKLSNWGQHVFNNASLSGKIDQLVYTYEANSNRLRQVSDASNDYASNLGDFKYDPNAKSGTDYSYDANGNLVSDQNKKIANITYNVLNLPQTITITGKGSIEYTYDAAGNKLKKVTTDNTGSAPKITTTLYLGESVYENDVLQFVSIEDGRIRYKQGAGSTPASFEYDYYLKDHLGNVRMVLTEEQQQDMYMASMEPNNAAYESAYFSDNASTVPKPSGFDVDISNTSVNKLGTVSNGRTGRFASNTKQVIGKGIVLKVMAGDKINVTVNAWHSAAYENASNPVTPILDNLIASLFLNGVAKLPGNKTGYSGGLTLGNPIVSAVDAFLSLSNQLNNQSISAYLNWIEVDDEQLNLVNGSYGFTAVPQQISGEKVPLQANSGNGIDIKKDGYIYIYVSNSSTDRAVFFDDLHVEHIRGSLLEETHYYPFGLTMAGISSKAAGGVENNLKYNGYEQQSKEFSDGSGLEWYDYKHRFYDNQIGRFFTQDDLASSFPYYSPYQFAGNEVPNAIDIDGLEPSRQNTQQSQPEPSFWERALYNVYRLLNYAGGKINESKGLPSDNGLQNIQALTDKVTETTLIFQGGLELGSSGYSTGRGNAVNTEVRAAEGAVASEENGVSLVINGRSNWTRAQNLQAAKKAQQLTEDAETVFTRNPVQREANTRSKFIKAGNQVSKTEDVDHIKDLQLGGDNDIFNLQTLDRSVNRSFGSQMQKQMKNLPDNTRIIKVIFIPK